ncbi:MAG: NAD-dependent epimerase/dehydratase family protein [Planctomycetota bacterium]
MRVLVTGCSGFLGREITRQLMDRGDQVVGLSRRSVSDLVLAGMTHHRGDLLDAQYVQRCVADVDAVIHTAAVAGVWGPAKYFFENNVIASRNVLHACQSARIENLVYTSSPSVTFDGDDQCSVDESVNYPSRWLCEYPRTKAIAEREILDADSPGKLRTVSLRPHLIWGPGDPHLLPRVLERAKTGRLRIVGDGENLIDTVHITNAAAAHLDAIDVLSSDPDRAGGRAYFIAQDEPVNCWQWISRLCQMHDIAPPTRSISYENAYRIGAVLESIFRITRRASEPPMTRFVASQLAKHHYFDITAAKQRLGYRVRIDMETGLGSLMPTK